MPDYEIVFPIGNVFDLVAPTSIALRKIRGGADDDVASHFRIDIKQQRDHAGLVKFERPPFALGPGAEIVSSLLIPANRWPENMVLHAIVVLKLDRRPLLH